MSKNNQEVHPKFFSYTNLKSLSVLVIIILAIRWSIGAPYHVPTGSMEPTIKTDDRLFVYKLAYSFKFPFTDYEMYSFSKVQRGDIVVFKYPLDTSIDYVKRVVGLPGDRIRIVRDILYINDKAQERRDNNFDRSILKDINDRTLPKDLFIENLSGLEHWTINNSKNSGYPNSQDTFPCDIDSDKSCAFKPLRHSTKNFIVPDGHYFFIGDNRDNSEDSRFWGVVPRSYIKGKALIVLWSLYSTKDHFFPSPRFTRFFQILK